MLHTKPRPEAQHLSPLLAVRSFIWCLCREYDADLDLAHSCCFNHSGNDFAIHRHASALQIRGSQLGLFTLLYVVYRPSANHDMCARIESDCAIISLN